jgi:hypothetical protein
MANKAERVYGVYEHKGISHVVSASFKKPKEEVAA